MRANIVQCLCNQQQFHDFLNNKHQQREFDQLIMTPIPLAGMLPVICPQSVDITRLKYGRSRPFLMS